MPILLVLIATIAFAAYQTGGLESLSEEISVDLTPDDAYYRWDDLFHKYSKMHGVPWRWIKAVCWVESDLGRDSSVAKGLANPNDVEGSKSEDGKSWGLMQVTLATANDVRPGTTVPMLNNAEISVDCGSRVLKRNMARFPSDPVSVFRAYNGGLGFASTVAGQRDTPAYAAKVINRIGKILEKQPGDETEVG